MSILDLQSSHKNLNSHIDFINLNKIKYSRRSWEFNTFSKLLYYGRSCLDCIILFVFA